MQPEFKEELVERSLEAAAQFADLVMPLAQAAFAFSADQVRMVPPGGVRVDTASLQMLPNAFRANLLHLVAGHNVSGTPPKIRRRGSPNNGLWLGLADTDLMARIYKVSRKHPVRPSGMPQERLITQARYQELLLQRSLLDDEEPLLDALFMWQSQGYEMTGGYVVIPNGWDQDGRLVTLGRRDVTLPDDLDDIATFPGVPDDTAVVGGPNMPIFMSKTDADTNDDRSLLGDDDEESLEPADHTEEGQ